MESLDVPSPYNTTVMGRPDGESHRGCRCYDSRSFTLAGFALALAMVGNGDVQRMGLNHGGMAMALGRRVTDAALWLALPVTGLAACAMPAFRAT
jgi:hypothetical protein